jgi:hypothetical protein
VQDNAVDGEGAEGGIQPGLEVVGGEASGHWGSKPAGSNSAKPHATSSPQHQQPKQQQPCSDGTPPQGSSSGGSSGGTEAAPRCSASPIQVRHAVVMSRAEGRLVPCGCGTREIRSDFCSE